jgi:hypothetical protein
MYTYIYIHIYICIYIKGDEPITINYSHVMSHKSQIKLFALESVMCF